MLTAVARRREVASITEVNVNVPLGLTVSPVGGKKPFLYPLRFSSWGPDKRQISKGKGTFLLTYTYIHRN